MLFGFRLQEATIPKTVEEWIKETLKGKSVTYAKFGRGIKEYPIIGAGWGNTRTHPGFFKQFPNPSQTCLFKFNPVPLGVGRVPEKTCPIAILSQQSIVLTNQWLPQPTKCQCYFLLELFARWNTHDGRFKFFFQFFFIFILWTLIIL